MSNPVETISLVARRLIQNELKFAKADLQRRRGTSQLLTQIARSLGALAPELSRDRLPHDPCRELALYSTRLEEALAEELGAQEAARLAGALAAACDKEVLFLEFRTSDRKKYLQEELEKSSILIQALANGIYMALPQDDGLPDGSARESPASRAKPADPFPG